MYTSHARLKEVTTRTGRVFDQITPTCNNQAFEHCKAVCDFVVYMGYHGKRRSFTVRGDELLCCACGPTNRFLTPKGELLKEFYAGDSPAEAAQIMRDAFNNKLVEVCPEELEEEEPEDEDTEASLEDDDNQDKEDTGPSSKSNSSRPKKKGK